MGITLHWRRFRYRSLMRCKARNVLYVPGVQLVHDSTYASSSVWQRHSRGAPAPRWCVPPEASCTSPSATTKTGQGTHLSRGSMSFTNALRRAAHCGPSDMECTLTFPLHQEFLKKSPGAQSYDLERDRHPDSAPTVSTRMRLLVTDCTVCAPTSVHFRTKNEFMDALAARRFGNKFRAKKFKGGFSYAPILVDLRGLRVFVNCLLVSL